MSTQWQPTIGLRIAIVLATLALSWLGMMAVHELGHVIHAWLSGGVVSRVVLDPRVISRTELNSNPSPHFVAWGGVIWGSILPLPAVLLVRRVAIRQLTAFFAGFCLVANGTYLLVGSLTRTGDPGDMLRLGSPVLVVLAIGGFGATLGLWGWHRLGPRAGFGAHQLPTAKWTAVALWGMLVAIGSAELAYG